MKHSLFAPDGEEAPVAGNPQPAAEAPASDGSAELVDSDFDFDKDVDKLFAEDEIDAGGESVDVSEPGDQPVSPPSPTAPASPESPAPTPTPTPPASPTPTPAPTPAPTPEPTPPAPAPEPAEQPATPTPQTPEQKAEAARVHAEQRAQFHSNLTGLYNKEFTEADRSQFAPEQLDIMSRMAATLHTKVLESAVYGIMEQLPQAIQRYQQMEKVKSDRQSEFFGKFPKLKGHEDTVTNLMRTYIAQNPTAKLDTVMTHVGAMAMMVTGQAMDAVPGVAAPTTTPAPSPSFSPASPAAGGGAIPRAPVKDLWGQLSEEFDQEEI